LLFPSLSSPVTPHHHLKDRQAPDVCCCVQWRMLHKKLVYSLPSTSLSSTPPSLYIWRWNMRTTTPTAVCSTIPSVTRLNISTSLIFVGQRK
ncbi:hypothetical protein M9458_007686, partial [Cirrhinus mrigala]